MKILFLYHSFIHTALHWRSSCSSKQDWCIFFCGCTLFKILLCLRLFSKNKIFAGIASKQRAWLSPLFSFCRVGCDFSVKGFSFSFALTKHFHHSISKYSIYSWSLLFIEERFGLWVINNCPSFLSQWHSQDFPSCWMLRVLSWLSPLPCRRVNRESRILENQTVMFQRCSEILYQSWVGGTLQMNPRIACLSFLCVYVEQKRWTVWMRK